MFEFRLTRARLLKEVVESIKDLVTNANFECTATGISLMEMDSIRVALVALLLRSEAFEHYRCDHTFSMGMNLANMATMLRCTSNDDIVSMEADEGGDTVKFTFEKPYKTSQYEMNLMDIESEDFHIPEIEYQAVVRMPASEFARICKDLSNVDKNLDTVIISLTNEGVRFSIECDVARANIICRTRAAADEREELTIVQMVNPVSLAFSLRHLNSFAKATPLAAQVTISMSRSTPMVVEYRMGNVGHIRFYLAPRIEEEVENTQTDGENEPNGETKPEPEIKLKEEIETDETKPQVEAKEVVEAVDAETDETEPQEDVKVEVEFVDAE